MWCKIAEAILIVHPNYLGFLYRDKRFVCPDFFMSAFVGDQISYLIFFLTFFNFCDRLFMPNNHLTTKKECSFLYSIIMSFYIHQIEFVKKCKFHLMNVEEYSIFVKNCLATIGVCIFYAPTSVGAFLFLEEF